MKLFTIGHSNHDINQFIQLLEDNGISMLVDVRSTPYSRYNPHFNKEALERSLGDRWIGYAHAGKYLGGRPADPGCYKSRKLPEEGTDYLHEVDYQEVMKRQWFIQGVERLLEIADEQTTAIMCSEADPSACHRHHLIAKYILEKFPEAEIYHILSDGKVFGANSLHSSVNKQSVEQLSFFPKAE